VSGKLPFKTVAAALATADPGILLKTPVRSIRSEPLPAASSAEVELGEADIVIELNDTPRPPALFLRGAAPAKGWAVVGNAHATFGKEMDDAGCVLFFAAGEVRASALGFDQAGALRHAFTQLTRKATARDCNALEITRITHSRLLGLSRVSVAVHLRHLQRGGPLCQTKPRQAKTGK